jgi:hypothetical protein
MNVNIQGEIYWDNFFFCCILAYTLAINLYSEQITHYHTLKPEKDTIWSYLPTLPFLKKWDNNENKKECVQWVYTFTRMHLELVTSLVKSAWWYLIYCILSIVSLKLECTFLLISCRVCYVSGYLIGSPSYRDDWYYCILVNKTFSSWRIKCHFWHFNTCRK